MSVQLSTEFPDDDDPQNEWRLFSGPESNGWVVPSNPQPHFSFSDNIAKPSYQSNIYDPANTVIGGTPLPLLTDDNTTKLRLKAAEQKIISLESQLQESSKQTIKLQSTLSTLESKVDQYEKQIAKVKQEEVEVASSLEVIKVDLDKATKDLEGTEKSISQLDVQVRNDKLQAIQVLALFVAFFTFVSVEFQLFTSLKSVASILALSLVLLGALLGFVCLTYLGIAYYSDKNNLTDSKILRFNKKFLVSLSVVSGFLIITGIGFNIWAVSQDNSARRYDELKTQKKDNMCQSLNEDIIKELKKKNSKTVNFMQERYRINCGQQ